MNILGLIFSLLLILSYGFYACWDKQVASSRLRKTYMGHEMVNRKILNRYQSEVYRQLRGKSIHTDPKTQSKEKVPETAAQKPKEIELNRECAKLNLWPLIQEGRSSQPMLYELTAKMIRTFYSPLQKQKKRFEYHFLDAFLNAAKTAIQEQPHFALEKIDMKDPDLQRTYYKMLKGTKKWDLSLGLGHPSLLDYIKAAPSKEKICLFHAHSDLIAVLFTQKVAGPLYEEIHKEDAPLLTKELVERICSEMHQIATDPELFELLELGHPKHQEHKKVFIAEDEKTDVSLRKSFYLKG